MPRGSSLQFVRNLKKKLQWRISVCVWCWITAFFLLPDRFSENMLKFAAERWQCFETLKLQRVVHVRKLMVSCSLSESNQEVRPPLTPHPPAPPRLELQMQNVSKFYKDRKVVDGISMNIGQHEVVGLFGPNGAGKSTTFNIIVGREQPSSGCVLLGAIDITRFSLQRRARLGIGYMTQVCLL